MKNAMFVLLLAVSTAFSSKVVDNPLDRGGCDAPANVHITSQSSGTISFDWNDSSGATGYQVWYQKQGGNASSPFVESVSNHTFSYLTTGTYDFYFQTVCDGEVSEIVVVEEIIMW